jgi:hypothetical protein
VISASRSSFGGRGWSLEQREKVLPTCDGRKRHVHLRDRRRVYHRPNRKALANALIGTTEDSTY